RPATVDAAFFGAPRAGQGVLATASFVTLAAGDPGIRIARLEARDAANHPLALPLELAAPSRVVPKVTSLALAAPNPFCQSTAFAFDLAERARVLLVLYSVDGRRVRTLVDEAREPGRYHLVWDGRDDAGRGLAAGVYYAQLVAGAQRFTHPV